MTESLLGTIQGLILLGFGFLFQLIGAIMAPAISLSHPHFSFLVWITARIKDLFIKPNWLKVSMIYYYFSIGTAGGTLVLIPEIRRWIKIRYYRKKFRLAEQGTRWELIDLQGGADKYVHDLRQSNLKHHVANPETFVDLHFDWNSIRHLQQQDWDSIPLSDPINTEKKIWR